MWHPSIFLQRHTRDMPKHSIVVDELRSALLELPIRPSLKAALQSLATAARRPLANYVEKLLEDHVAQQAAKDR
jgi:hypothetical protein